MKYPQPNKKLTDQRESKNNRVTDILERIKEIDPELSRNSKALSILNEDRKKALSLEDAGLESNLKVINKQIEDIEKKQSDLTTEKKDITKEREVLLRKIDKISLEIQKELYINLNLYIWSSRLDSFQNGKVNDPEKVSEAKAYIKRSDSRGILTRFINNLDYNRV